MKIIPQIKLFVSSPSDVLAERNIVEDTVQQINKNEGLEKSFNINIYRWENDFKPEWDTYQKQINKELVDTDIFVGILWNRFGTPTDEYFSGTEEEFEKTLELVKKGKKIELCFYKCMKTEGFNSNDSKQLDQKKRVNDFFCKYNNNVFSTFDYKDTRKFEEKIRHDILAKVYSILSRTNNLEIINESFDKNGITKLYTPELNELRNQDKKDFLNHEDGDICLLAHSGNSFLHTSREGNPGRFFQEVKERLLHKSGKFKVLVLNPYSLEARKIFYAENFDSYQNDISNIKDTQTLERGKNYLRFEKCLQGIDEIKEELGSNSDRLEVRITNVATDGTVLMSDNRLFYEPYVASRFLNRIGTGLNLFEIQVKNLLKNRQCSSIYDQEPCKVCEDKYVCAKNLYKTLSEQFYILWATSISLTEYREQQQQDKYKEDFSKTQPDLFYKQIIQLHDSWFAFDPVIGCNGNCVYCFLGPQGWKNANPHLRKNPNEEDVQYIKNAYEKQLLEYQYFKPNDCENELLGSIPISIGNKTDMLFKSNMNYLQHILDLHKQKKTKRPLVFITKQEIDLELIDKIKEYPFDVIFLCSIAFLSNEFEPYVPKYKKRLEFAEKVRKKIDEEKIKNIFLIHYWRPIIDFVEESLDDIIKQVQTIFDCSICIGLKVNKNISKSIEFAHPKLFKYIEEKGGVEILSPSFEKIQKVAKFFSYPVFQHTSCALSYVQKKADFNGSMWRENFCISCVQEQKYRCKLFKKNWDENNYIPLLNKSVGDNNYSIKEDCIKIESTISQEKMTNLTHLIGKPVFSDSIQLTLVWPSGNQLYYKEKYSQKDVFEDVKTKYPFLTEQLERLKGITGFISILGNDNKIIAFNRLDHVNRVVRLLKWYIRDLKDIDFEKCAFLGLFHDINRLPFAHNLEKAIKFSQNETIRYYMALFNTTIDETYYDDFNSFFKKNLCTSKESRIVYLIDAVEGFIEDSLFALVMFNLIISEDILLTLGFDDKVVLEQDISRLKELYNRDINLFREEFGDVTFEYAKAFIDKYKKDKYKIFDDDEFFCIRDKIKNKLMIEQIFPINNEFVSKGSKLSSEIGKPYIEYLKKNYEGAYLNELFKQTDRGLLKEAISKGIITNEEHYYPNLSL